MPEKINKASVLVAALDWGFGHTTRCIPVIRSLCELGYSVLIAGNTNQLFIVKKEFPDAIYLDLKGYEIRYSTSKWLFPLTLLMQVPKILYRIRKEHQWLDSIIDRYKPEFVISDNRYGLYSSRLPCILITHQLQIKAPLPFLEKLIRQLHYRFINKFCACWVPDTAGIPNAAGILSHPDKMPSIPVHYMGILCRFSQKSEIQTVPFTYDLCILLSGPEPSRSILEQTIFHQLKKEEGSFVFIRGIPSDKNSDLHLPNTVFYNHKHGTELKEILENSQYILCRSGYTTVMELLALHKHALFIPTPGQTEQEYLGEKLLKDSLSIRFSQKNFNLHIAITEARQFNYTDVRLQEFTTLHLKQLLEETGL